MNNNPTVGKSIPEILTEDAARMFVERVRWSDRPVCPRCRSPGAYRLRPKAESKRPVRAGVLKCRACRRQFTVTVGTAFEHSHISLLGWLSAIRYLCDSREGLSAYQLHRLAGVSRQSASFMLQRIREGVVNRGAPFEHVVASMLRVSPSPPRRPPMVAKQRNRAVQEARRVVRRPAVGS